MLRTKSTHWNFSASKTPFDLLKYAKKQRSTDKMKEIPRTVKAQNAHTAQPVLGERKAFLLWQRASCEQQPSYQASCISWHNISRAMWQLIGVLLQWLSRDSQLSLRTLWSAVIKSPRLSARSTAPPLHLLHGALVILDLWQISQSRSLGKWEKTLCLPRSALLASVGSKMGHEKNWRVSLCVQELCHPQDFSEFLQPFRYVGILQVSPF